MTATYSTRIGEACVAISVATSGPTTKISSSRIDSSEYAVVSSGRPASTADHRARTSDSTGRYVNPARTVGTINVQSAAPVCSMMASVRTAAACAMVLASHPGAESYPAVSKVSLDQ